MEATKTLTKEERLALAVRLEKEATILQEFIHAGSYAEHISLQIIADITKELKL